MDLNRAATLEGMLIISRHMLQGVLDYVQDNVPDDKRRDMLIKVGTAITELLVISWSIHEEHPVLNPYPEETRLAAEMRAKRALEGKE